MPTVWDQLKEILDSSNKELAKVNAEYGYSSPHKDYLNMIITIIEAILILHKNQEENNVKAKKKN